MIVDDGEMELMFITADSSGTKSLIATLTLRRDPLPDNGVLFDIMMRHNCGIIFHAGSIILTCSHIFFFFLLVSLGILLRNSRCSSDASVFPAVTFRIESFTNK